MFVLRRCLELGGCVSETQKGDLSFGYFGNLVSQVWEWRALESGSFEGGIRCVDCEAVVWILER